jgi:hypothetical protein
VLLLPVARFLLLAAMLRLRWKLQRQRLNPLRLRLCPCLEACRLCSEAFRRQDVVNPRAPVVGPRARVGAPACERVGAGGVEGAEDVHQAQGLEVLPLLRGACGPLLSWGALVGCLRLLPCLGRALLLVGGCRETAPRGGGRRRLCQRPRGPPQVAAEPHPVGPVGVEIALVRVAGVTE